MIKRLTVILLAIFYIGTAALSNASCRLWMGSSANHVMASMHPDCTAMSAKEKPGKDCCKQICQELRGIKTSALDFGHKAQVSLPALLPRIRFAEIALCFPVGTPKDVSQPPSVGRSVPLFLRLRNFRI